jgi:hypothetical protein
MSRRTPRVRARFAATVEVAGLPHTLVCHTRDISVDGCFLDTGEVLAPGVAVSLALMDAERGEVVQIDGVVARCLPGDDGNPRGVGVKLTATSPGWQGMVARYHQVTTGTTIHPPTRLAVLVVGDEQQRRAALALYVSSGWDVRFAIDVDSAAEALGAIAIDAVIADFEPGDPRGAAILETARQMQPRARRLARVRDGASIGDDPLIQQVVVREAGIDGLVEALIGEASA